jgi:hypothetical protein
LSFQDAKRALKEVYGHSDSNSSNGGSWDITSRCIIKMLHHAVAAAAPVPRTMSHKKRMEMSISFDASDCPKSMSGAGHLLIVISPTIANVSLHHILIDGGQPQTLSVKRLFKSCRFPCLGSLLRAHFRK